MRAVMGVSEVSVIALPLASHTMHTSSSAGGVPLREIIFYTNYSPGIGNGKAQLVPHPLYAENRGAQRLRVRSYAQARVLRCL